MTHNSNSSCITTVAACVTTQVGRAGRDGQEAQCVAFLDDADFRTLRSLAHSDGVDAPAVAGFLAAVFADPPPPRAAKKTARGKQQVTAYAVKQTGDGIDCCGVLSLPPTASRSLPNPDAGTVGCCILLHKPGARAWQVRCKPDQKAVVAQCSDRAGGVLRMCANEPCSGAACSDGSDHVT